MLLQGRGLQLLLIGEQAVVHRLAFPWSLAHQNASEAFRANGWSMSNGKSRSTYLTSRRNVFLLELWQRPRTSGTEGALVISKFDECKCGLLVAFREGVRDAECGIDITNRWALVAARRPEFFYFLQLIS